MRIRPLLAPGLTLALLALAVAAWAGPPLLCFPYEVDNRPVLDPRTPHDKVVTELVSLLDQEPETLVRMENIRRAAMSLNGDRDLGQAALAALRKRVETKAAALPETFDLAFAAETFGQATGDASKTTEALAAAVAKLPSDPAAWLGLACANTPLMRRGTLADHAAAFLKAWDGASALPEGPIRERLTRTLRHQLDTLEAYLVKEAASREERLAELRKLAAKE